MKLAGTGPSTAHCIQQAAATALVMCTHSVLCCADGAGCCQAGRSSIAHVSGVHYHQRCHGRRCSPYFRSTYQDACRAQRAQQHRAGFGEAAVTGVHATHVQGAQQGCQTKGQGTGSYADAGSRSVSSIQQLSALSNCPRRLQFVCITSLDKLRPTSWTCANAGCPGSQGHKFLRACIMHIACCRPNSRCASMPAACLTHSLAQPQPAALKVRQWATGSLC